LNRVEDAIQFLRHEEDSAWIEKSAVEFTQQHRFFHSTKETKEAY